MHGARTSLPVYAKPAIIQAQKERTIRAKVGSDIQDLNKPTGLEDNNSRNVKSQIQSIKVETQVDQGLLVKHQVEERKREAARRCQANKITAVQQTERQHPKVRSRLNLPEKPVFTAPPTPLTKKTPYKVRKVYRFQTLTEER